MRKQTRRMITLIEIMIVMFLIALIMGVLAYNYRGSMDEGKAFKTKAAIERVETILNLAVSEKPERLNSITTEWTEIVRQSPLVSNPNSFLVDGWGGQFQITVDEQGVVHVNSQKYDDYLNTHQGTMFGK